jgi:hypothetical protein
MQLLAVRTGEVRPCPAGPIAKTPSLELMFILGLAGKCWQLRKLVRREAESGCMARGRIKVFYDRIGRSAFG